MPSDRLKAAGQLVSVGTKVEHMNQMQDGQRVCHAIRIANLLRGPKVRDKYIAQTQPTLRPLLLERPKKK